MLESYYLIVALAVVIGLFLLGREIVLWYFKINEAITILKDIRATLRNEPASPSKPERIPIDV